MSGHVAMCTFILCTFILCTHTHHTLISQSMCRGNALLALRITNLHFKAYCLNGLQSRLPYVSSVSDKRRQSWIIFCCVTRTVMAYTDRAHTAQSAPLHSTGHMCVNEKNQMQRSGAAKLQTLADTLITTHYCKLMLLLRDQSHKLAPTTIQGIYFLMPSSKKG